MTCRHLLLWLLCLPLVSSTTAFAGEVPARPLFRPAAAALAASAQHVPSLPDAHAKGTAGIGSFMYFNADRWSFWWLGQRITPDNVPQGMTGLSVSPDAVRFTYDGAVHEFVIGKFN